VAAHRTNHDFVAHQRFPQTGGRIAQRRGGQSVQRESCEGLRGKLKVPHRDGDRDGRTTLIGGDGDLCRYKLLEDCCSVRAARKYRSSTVDSAGADRRIAGLEGGRRAAQRRTGSRSWKGMSGSGYVPEPSGGCCLRRNSPCLDRNVDSRYSDALCRDRCPAGTRERGGAQVQLVKPLAEPHDNLGVHRFARAPGQRDQRTVPAASVFPTRVRLVIPKQETRD